MQSTSMWALWCLLWGSQEQVPCVSGEPRQVGHVWRVMGTTEPVCVLGGCTSRKSSSRNISETKTVIEVYALSQFAAVNEVLG